MEGSQQHIYLGTNLDQLAQVENCYLVGDKANYRQVMRDKQTREAERALKLLQQIENLGLH